MRNILFIGNSFTYYNHLPELFAGVCTSAGKQVNVQSITCGGYYLHQYLNPEDKKGAEVMSVLKENTFDFVILQDQSMNPVTYPADFANAVSSFRSLLPAETLIELYQTWSYAPDNSILLNKGWSYDEMAEALSASYHKVAMETGSICCPVGNAMANVHKRYYPSIDLYDSDRLHPSLAGSYLSALCHSMSLFSIHPQDISFRPEGISEQVASILKSAAESVIFSI